jgi:two-component system, chemotaxis family, chemotaxis protein CheY
MRILIVDDSRAMRMIVTRVLRQSSLAGATFEEAADGVEALAAIRASAPDLVLSDWNMPEMSGIELLRTLRAEGIDVPFGFVTSESTAEMWEQARIAGARFLVAKPFTVDSFEGALGSVVG